MSGESHSLVRLGAGSFGTVYVWQGYQSVAVKVVADINSCGQLAQEYANLEHIQGVDHGLVISVPRPMRLYNAFDDFKEEMQEILHMDASEHVSGAACAYVMERVFAPPPAVVSLIRKLFFPEPFKANRQYFVARLYLGQKPRSRDGRPLRFFNPLNFPLDADRLNQLKLGVSTARIASDMGKMMARFHYLKRTDANDVEFVLGGDPSDPLHKARCYCIDFDKVHPWSTAQDLVDSFTRNDPYFPKPSSDYWLSFADGYLMEAPPEERDVAKEVLQGLEKAWRK